MPLEKRERKKIDSKRILMGQLAQENRKKCNSEVVAKKRSRNICPG